MTSSRRDSAAPRRTATPARPDAQASDRARRRPSRSESDQPADDDVAEEAQSYFRLDASVRARPAARRLRGARRGLLQPGQRRGDRPRVSLRHHARSAGRRASLDAEQDNPVLRPVRRLEAERLPCRCRSRSCRSVEGLDELPSELSARHRRDRRRATSDGFASLYATPAFVWHTHAVDCDQPRGARSRRPGAELPDEHAGPQRHVVPRPRRRASASVRRSSSPPKYAPRLAATTRARAKWGVAIEKLTGGPHAAAELHATRSAPPSARSRAAAAPHDVYLGFNLVRRF